MFYSHVVLMHGINLHHHIGNTVSNIVEASRMELLNSRKGPAYDQGPRFLAMKENVHSWSESVPHIHVHPMCRDQIYVTAFLSLPFTGIPRAMTLKAAANALEKMNSWRLK